MKTSIKIKKFWIADVAADGGVGANWQEVQVGQREATVQYNGSDADVENYKNVLGGILESAKTKGDMTANFQLADLTPELIASLTGGISTTSSEADTYEEGENENQSIEKSIKFLTEKDIEFILPRVSVDAYPIINDDDLHYYQVNTVRLTPEKAGEPAMTYHVLKLPDSKVITSFSVPQESVAAVIDGGAFTVAVTVPGATDVTALVPTIGVSLGASVDPRSGLAQDYTSPVTYTVEAADGSTQAWVVTVTAV